MRRLSGLFQLAIGGIQSLLLTLWYRPRAVVGFGSYTSVMPVITGGLLGRPAILHEQNAFFGRTNRFLARFSREIAVSWKSTRNIPASEQSKVFMAGMPVRQAFRNTPAYTPPAAKGKVRLLIIGGSLGAHIFGETVPEAIRRLPAGLRARLLVTQQVRQDQIGEVRARYDDAGVTSELYTFIDNMPEQLRQSHLVISRAGASSVAELAASGCPAVLVPFPGAMDDHQTANASTIADAGGGWCVPEKELSAGSLAGRIAALIENPEKLSRAAKAIRSLDPGPAATILAEHAMALIKGRAAA
jgi:UDP-N-acetylglucosamine--N-acetylmuramyl-(pentapeptide) pyrophosphoryl-undecaprenol N-acetylglucosamine transferase